jgi:hypothetical protein
MSDINEIKPAMKLTEDFDYEMGEQTRMELTEAEQEFLKVLDQEEDIKRTSQK